MHDKPRIYKTGDYEWVCIGGVCWAEGHSPKSAYQMWKAYQRFWDWGVPPQATREPDSFWSHDMRRMSVFEWILILSPLLAIAWFSIMAVL